MICFPNHVSKYLIYFSQFHLEHLFHKMAGRVAWEAVLTRCGVTSAPTRDVIITQGYTDMADFSQLDDKDIKTFVKEVNKMPAVGAPPVRPTIPFASIKKLQAMRRWCVERVRMGLELNPGSFIVAELERMLTRMDFEAHLLVNKPETPPLPDKFINFGAKWLPFYEGLKGYLEVDRGSMNIPLIYVCREHETVTNEMRDATYSTTDERLMTCVVLRGNEYREDNKRVWDLIRPLVYGTTAWNYVKQFDRMRDGRGAFHVLQRRGEGEAALDSRRTKAEETIATAKYTGRSKRFTLQTYTNILQGAFTELDEVGEGYSERRKVDVYVKGMQADRLRAMKLSIMSNPRTRNDFMEAYTFVETMEQFDKNVTSGTDAFDRTISSVEKGNSGNVDTSYRSWKDWQNMSSEEKSRVTKARGGKGGSGKNGGNSKGNDKAFNKLKRKLAKLAAKKLKTNATDNTAESDTIEPGNDDREDGGGKRSKSNDVSDQFGREAHALLTVMRELDGTSQK